MKSPVPPAIPSRIKRRLGTRMITWFRHHKRPMPWRATTDPYAIWLSEVMLQQTQVATVEPYYHRFLLTFPDVNALAAAPLEEVLKLWAGLGYYRRAKSLHQSARIIASKYHGVFPSMYNEILQLPGIGRYTAGAIASIAFNRSVPVLDGNVMRVLTRLWAIHADITRPQTQKILWSIAETLVPRQNPGDFNQAMMELGATVCLPNNPRCKTCPLENLCAARRENSQNQLPVKKGKSTTPRIQLAAVVLQSPQGQLLGKRSAGGLWEHIWEFPAFEIRRPTAATVGHLFFALTGLRIKLKRRPGIVRHQLTHRRMEYVIFSARSSSSPVINFNSEPAFNYDAIRWIADIKSVPVARITAKIAAHLDGQ